MSLEQQISKGIMEAMKAKDTVRLGALRNAKKYIIEAKTAGLEITELPDADGRRSNMRTPAASCSSIESSCALMILVTFM